MPTSRYFPPTRRHLTPPSEPFALEAPAGEGHSARSEREASSAVSVPASSPVTPVLAEVQSIPGIRAATPYIYTEVLLSTPRGATGLVLRGVDPSPGGRGPASAA